MGSLEQTLQLTFWLEISLNPKKYFSLKKKIYVHCRKLIKYKLQFYHLKHLKSKAIPFQIPFCAYVQILMHLIFIKLEFYHSYSDFTLILISILINFNTLSLSLYWISLKALLTDYIIFIIYHQIVFSNSHIKKNLSSLSYLC